MAIYRRAHWMAVAALATAMCSFGQTLDCQQKIAAAAVARATSPTDLPALRAKAGTGILADLVFAARDFQLASKDVAKARHLLSMMPHREIEDYPDETSENVKLANAMLAMGDGLCPEETEKDLTTLSVLQEALPGLFAEAVILAPEFLPQYLAYDMWAVGDPHNDSNVHAEKVCRARRAEFTEAVAALAEEARDQFKKEVFDVRRCRAIWLPEADE